MTNIYNLSVLKTYLNVTYKIKNKFIVYFIFDLEKNFMPIVLWNLNVEKLMRNVRCKFVENMKYFVSDKMIIINWFICYFFLHVHLILYN
jgi:hypothetical protein